MWKCKAQEILMKKEGSRNPIINETKKWSSSLRKKKVQRKEGKVNEKGRKRNFSDDLDVTEKGVTPMNRENLEKNKFDEGRKRKQKEKREYKGKEGKYKCVKNSWFGKNWYNVKDIDMSNDKII